MQALIICYTERTSWQLPALLHRAGFHTDVISRSPLLKKSRFIRTYVPIAADQSAVKQAVDFLQNTPEDYDWIIITEEEILQEVLTAPIDEQLRLKLLPVLSKDHLHHINSKIGLAHTLHQHKVLTPPYQSVKDFDATLAAADRFGYPILLKVEASTGGYGVYDCAVREDLLPLKPLFTGQALLLQKKIAGRELDVSAIYRKGVLLHYSYSRIAKTMRPYGPSLLRHYYPLATLDSQVFEELSQLGHALGADGFVNISCIETDDLRRYYFEADMRPTVWVEYSKFFNEDPAIAIRTWFLHGIGIKAKPLTHTAPAKPITIPYFARMPTWQLLINRYNVWKFIPYQDRAITRALLWWKVYEALLALPFKKWLPQTLKAKILQRLCLA